MNITEARRRLKPIAKLISRFEELESSFLEGDNESLDEMGRLLPRLLQYLQDLRSVPDPDEQIQEILMVLPDVARLAIYHHSSPAERLQIFLDARSDAETFGYEIAAVLFSRHVGTSLQDLGRLTEAIDVLTRCVDDISSIEEAHDELGLVVGELASCLRDSGRFPEAKQVAIHAVELLREAGDESMAANALSNLGAVQYELGEMQDAETTLQEAARIQEKFGMNSDLGATHGNLASLYSECGQHEKAIEYSKRSLIQARADRNMPEIAIRLVNMASVTRESGNISEAIRIASEAEHIARDFLLPVIECHTLIERADCFFEMDCLQEACELLERAEKLGEDSGNSQNVAAALSLHGRIMIDLQKSETAVSLLVRAKELFTTATDRSGIAGVDHHLAIAHHAMGSSIIAREFAISSFRLYRQIGHRRTESLRQWACSTLGMTVRDFDDV